MFADALVHLLSVVLISGAIILVGIIVLNPTIQKIKSLPLRENRGGGLCLAPMSQHSRYCIF